MVGFTLLVQRYNLGLFLWKLDLLVELELLSKCDPESILKTVFLF